MRRSTRARLCWTSKSPARLAGTVGADVSAWRRRRLRRHLARRGFRGAIPGRVHGRDGVRISRVGRASTVVVARPRRGADREAVAHHPVVGDANVIGGRRPAQRHGARRTRAALKAAGHARRGNVRTAAPAADGCLTRIPGVRRIDERDAIGRGDGAAGAAARSLAKRVAPHQAAFAAGDRRAPVRVELGARLGARPETQLVDQAFVVFVLREEADGCLLLRAPEPAALIGVEAAPAIPPLAHVRACRAVLGVDQHAVLPEFELRTRRPAEPAHQRDVMPLSIEQRGRVGRGIRAHRPDLAGHAAAGAVTEQPAHAAAAVELQRERAVLEIAAGVVVTVEQEIALVPPAARAVRRDVRARPVVELTGTARGRADGIRVVRLDPEFEREFAAAEARRDRELAEVVEVVGARELQIERRGRGKRRESGEQEAAEGGPETGISAARARRRGRGAA